MITDAIGRPINIGDTVYYMPGKVEFQGLTTVKGFTDSCRVTILDPFYGHSKSTTVTSSRLLVVDAQVKVNKQEYPEYYI